MEYRAHRAPLAVLCQVVFILGCDGAAADPQAQAGGSFDAEVLDASSPGDAAARVVGDSGDAGATRSGTDAGEANDDACCSKGMDTDGGSRGDAEPPAADAGANPNDAATDAGTDGGADAGPPRDPRIGMRCDDVPGVEPGGGLGDECGSDRGACEKGRLSCSADYVICLGETLPVDEQCNGADDDCDGLFDEGIGTEPLCDAPSSCALNQCAAPCDGSPPSESCPEGKAVVHVDIGGSPRCLCVTSECDADTCAQETVVLDGEVLCAPSSAQRAACVCRQNVCSTVCAGVVCQGGETCDLADGACKSSS